MIDPVHKLHSLRSVTVEVPMARALGTSADTIRSAPLLLIDVETEDGLVGHAYLFCYVAAAGPAIARMLEAAFDMVRGDVVAPQEIAAKLHKRFRLIGVQGIVRMALAGLDIALWDIASKAAGLPLCAMLGARPHTLRAYNSNGLGLMAPEACADEAVELLEGGFSGVKLRLGRSTLAADLAAVRAVRRRLPDDIGLMVDFNQGLDFAEALARGRALEGEGVYWIEEPIRHDDYAGNAMLTRSLRVPTQIGENFSGATAMATALEQKASTFVMPDLERIGGVTGWVRAAGLAAGFGTPMSTHLFPEVSAHLLAATPTAHWLEYVDWAQPILREKLRIVGGAIAPSSAPGVGLAWDDEAVARYRLDP
jgi:mandelate racemase